jgi:mono/diheme cytochrome c family protein
MTMRIRCLSAAILVAVMSAGIDAGGWVVVTLMNVPDHLVAGRPFTLGYSVRQHAVTNLDGLHGRVEARQGSTVVQAKTSKLPRSGSYGVNITFPEAGKWAVDVISGSKLVGHTLRFDVDVIRAADPPPRMSDAERGRRLFIGKGCLMCHAHDGVSGGPSWSRLPLPVRRHGAEDVKTFLSALPDAAARPVSGSMPGFDLAEPEIEALAAFLSR